MEQIKDPIRSINSNSDDCSEQYMKIIFHSDDEDLPLKKHYNCINIIIFFPMRTTNAIHEEVFLDDFLYKLAWLGINVGI